MQERIQVSMGWRLADDRWVKATYDTRVIAYEEDKDRWLVVLESITNPATLDNAPAEARELIEHLAGKWAYVPDEARHGTTLPLKYGTLTGAPRFFYTGDPREMGSGGAGVKRR